MSARQKMDKEPNYSYVAAKLLLGNIHKEVLEIIEIVKSHGGIKYAKNKMEELRLKAVEIINKFDDSETKNSLIELTNYMITRKK